MPKTVLPSGATVTTFPVPAKGFDLFTADEASLKASGMPRPPTNHPELLERWKRAVGRPMTFIEPTFQRSETKRHRPRHRAETANTAFSDNWSGAVVQAPAGATFVSVSGQWTIPTPNAPARNGVQYHSSIWVGIDGDGSDDVFQAGVDCDAKFDGNTSRTISAWWEWYPENSVDITNFSVSPNDVVTCICTVDSPTDGTIFFSNSTTGIATTFRITAPKGTTLRGNCAEWIVERPDVNDKITELTNFGHVEFVDVNAMLSSNVAVLPGSGDDIDMTESAKVISDGSIDASHVVHCTYEGPVAQLTKRAKQVAVARNTDGRLEVFYIGDNDTLFHVTQLTANGNWSQENYLGRTSNKGKRLAVTSNRDGRLEVFYLGTDDVLFHMWQTSPGGAWSPEHLLAESTNKAKEIAVGRNDDGRLEVFYVGTNDVLFHTWQTSPGGAWSGEHLLAAPTNKGKQLTVGQNADGRLEIFYIGTNDVLFHNWQTSPNGAWSGEHLLAAPTNKGKQLTVGQNADGRLEVFYIGTNDVLFHNWQTSAGGAWSGEHLLAAPTNKAKQITVGRDADRRLEVFYVGTNDVLYHNWQTSPNGAWSGEHLLAAPTNKGKRIAIASDADGRLELFYAGTNDVLYHAWQQAPNGSWSGESEL